jgi:cytochrome c oxidase cbb3-type subunit III
MADRKKDDVTGVETTGHEWDGITELDNPLPRWWVQIFYATIAWSVIYWVLMPAWPVPGGHTPGVLGKSDRAAVVTEVGALQATRAPMFKQLQATPLDQVRNNPDLLQFAQEAGRSAFADNCATCHGAGGQGAKGYPNLADDVWIWDGSVAGIKQTINYGVRNAHPDTRYSQMPSYGRDKLLEPAQIDQLVEHVVALSGRPADRTKAAAGAALFATNCVSCHGVDAKGDRAQGAPNLTDREWLYGGERTEIRNQIYWGRGGVMSAWSQRLEPATIDALSVYVHSLGGGE